MKIVRPICCGMDVHKNIIVATIGISDKKTRITEYIQETFSTLNPDLLNLLNNRLSITNALMHVWNLLVNIGFQF